MDSTQLLIREVTELPQLSHWDRIFIRALQNLKGGEIRLSLADGTRVCLGQADGESATLTFQDCGLSKRLLLGGGMALAESYIEGQWVTNDLSALLRILGRSQRDMGGFARGTSRVLKRMDTLLHRLRRNTRENAVKNIQEHYDLSNEMYETFLDPTLTYSSAIFDRENEDLESAQFRKIDRLIDSLKPEAHHHVLEIGSGWGACAIRLARRCGCRVTSLTLSERQAEEGRRRVKEAGVEDRVEIRIQDYRDVEGTFDHAISIEMIEAVGDEFLPEYFDVVRRRLKPGGRFALQAITIPDDRYEDYNNSVDFIRKHIFPGGHLPSPGRLRELSRAHALELMDEFEFGRDYAETLRRWCRNFLKNADRVRDLGFDTEFIRKWQYYLCYCEAGFDTGLIHVRQLCYRKTES